MSTGSTTARTGAARFSRDVALTLGARLFIAAGSFVSGVIVARWLGAASVGVLASLNVLALIAVTFGSLGLPSATTYLVASDKTRVSGALANSVLFAVSVGSLLSTIIVGIYYLRPTVFGDVPGPMLYITAAIIPFQLLSLLCLSIFLGLGRIASYNFLDMATPAALVISPIVLLVFLGLGLFELVWVNAVAITIISMLVLWTANRAAGDKRTGPDRSLLKETFRYGSRFYIAMAASVIILRADLLIVNYFRGAAEAGVYAVATQFGTLLMLVPSVISTVLFPRATEARDGSGEMTSRVTRHVVLIMFLTCLAAVPFAFLLPLFFGNAFANTSWQVLVLLPGVFLFAVETVMVQHFSGKGLPPAIPAFWIATLVINIGLDLVFVPRYGAMAAAAVSSISYAMIFALVTVYFWTQTGIGPGKILIMSVSELKDLLRLRTFSVVQGK